MSRETVTVLAGQHGLGAGCFKGAAAVLQTRTTLVAWSVCRWIASECDPADEPSRSKRCRPRKHSDVDQCATDASESTPNLELLTVLSAEAARVAGEETQFRKLSRDRSYAGAADLKKREDGYLSEDDTKKEGVYKLLPKLQRPSELVSTPPRRIVLPRADPSRRDHDSVFHRRAQQVSGLWRNDEGQAEAVGKVGRDGGGNAGIPALSKATAAEIA